MSAKKTLVIVESPTKARTIRKFLGKDFIVESCMGHIRDLPKSAKDIPEKFKKKPWKSLGVNIENNFDPMYCIPKNKTKIVKLLKTKLKEADELILATDEDREGESISWHLLEVLKPKIPTKRMVFHEITKKAIQEALTNFREVDINLVKAQEARRVLDRLVGYTLSPVIWKKVAYGLSAGRVQSVAVRLISEKEHDRIRFVKSNYWSLLAKCEKDNVEFDAKLQSFKGQKIAIGKDFDAETGKLKDGKNLLHLNSSSVEDILNGIKDKKFDITQVEEKPLSRKPSAPFITSTLQQEANRKLGWGSRETMQVAQKLYERGFITYMRTDSSFLSNQALKAARESIEEIYGKKYLPDEPRNYVKKKVKGAQEAHEAIRPAGEEFKTPEETGLKTAQFKLYDLIWKRTMASQMKNSEHKQMSVKLEVGDATFMANGTTIEFPGFLKAYVEGSDNPEQALDNREVRLPKLKVKDSISANNLKSNEHETKPPARYTEASLVQKMEKEGIGRPSTYAAIISTVQNRGYVKKVGNALIPTFTALVVSKLLVSYFPDYVDTSFTSGMEDSLDSIAQGDQDWVKYLDKIYFGEKGIKTQVEEQEDKIDSDTSRSIVLQGLEGLDFRVGRYGAYVCKVDKSTGEEVCASVPESHFPADMTAEMADKFIDLKINGADALGEDPETGLSVYALTGRYGPYVQLGESDGGDAETKPKRVSIPANINMEEITFEQAQQLLSLPITLGDHPGTEKVVKANIGRFGPYIVHDGDFRSIPKEEEVFDITFERALELLAMPKKRGRSSALKELGNFPDTEDKISVFSGKYGPYLKCGKVNVSIPEDIDHLKIELEKAVELLADKVAESGKKAKKKKAKKKATKKKKTKKKAAKKKTTKKKKAKKKTTKKKTKKKTTKK